MERFIYYNDLLTYYGKLLTDKNYKIFELYYAENLSLQEIADILKVSKSFVGNSIKKTEKKLDDLENKIQLYKKYHDIKNLLNNNNLEQIKEYMENTW